MLALQKILAQVHIVSAALMWGSLVTKVVVSFVMSTLREPGCGTCKGILMRELQMSLYLLARSIASKAFARALDSEIRSSDQTYQFNSDEQFIEMHQQRLSF